MLRFFVVTVLFSVAFAQTKYCCTPDQWEGFIAELSGDVQAGVPNLINGTISMAYDYTNKLMAQTIHLHLQGKLQVVTTIYNYPTKTAYSIIGSVCTPSPIGGNMEKFCVPDSATPVGTIYYGETGDMFPVDVYSVPSVQGITKYLTTTMSNPCVPVSDALFGTTSQAFAVVQSLAYYNITPGIKDPSVFIPPSSCSGTSRGKAPNFDQHLIHYMSKKMTSQ